RPVVAVILERGEFTRADSVATASTLCFYALGLAGYFAQQILTRAFYSLQESKTPARTALLAVGISLILNLVLIWPLGSGGLAAATALCSYIQVAMLLTALRRRLGPGVLAGTGGALRDTAVATIFMAGAVVGIQYLLGQSARVLSLGLAVFAGTVVYGAVARVLHIEMLSLFLGRGRRSAA
ncbi:MAG TPA: lipid II flippase MurJ, partial [Sedimentisphaerales bacterium]|nr:lipid II flippase MurJ [Sedimentisphaerales bacterium]